VVYRKPIEKLEFDSDEFFFIPLNYGGFGEDNLGLSFNSARLAEAISKLRRIVSEDLSWQARQIGQSEKPPNNFAKGIFEAVELKVGAELGIFAFKVDLKKVGAQILESMRAQRSHPNQ
jgi:hypothetical protein